MNAKGTQHAQMQGSQGGPQTPEAPEFPWILMVQGDIHSQGLAKI